jgi:hypothetical protein
MASHTVDGSFISDEKPTLENENEKHDISEKNSPPVTTSSSSISDGEGINEKAILRKLDYKLLPPLTLLYLLSFLDRSNGMISLIRVHGEKDSNQPASRECQT